MSKKTFLLKNNSDYNLNIYDLNNSKNRNKMNSSFCYNNKNLNLNDKYLKSKIEEYKKQIKKMNECLKFNDENHEEQIKIIKNNIKKYINENITLKTSNDKLLLENNYKDKEIEKYKTLIQEYQKLLNNNEKEKYVKNNIDEKNNNSNNVIILEAKLEKIKTENLLILSDLKKEKSDHNNTKLILNHYKENILVYEKKISKKNLKILNLRKEIKKLKNSLNNATIKCNLQNIDSSVISGSCSTPSKLNINNENNSYNFSNYSLNSKNTNNTLNDNILKNMSKIKGENNFLRKELQKIKNRLYDCNVLIQIYESQEEENLKIKQIIQNMNDYIYNIINQKIILINYINKQIKELNESNTNSDFNLKFDLIDNCNSNINNNLSNFTLNDISFFIKYIFNKILSLCYYIDINKNKEQYYKKEIKDNDIEKKILQDQIFEKDCDIEAYKETIKNYENTIRKLKEENNHYNNNKKRSKSKKYKY